MSLGTCILWCGRRESKVCQAEAGSILSASNEAHRPASHTQPGGAGDGGTPSAPWLRWAGSKEMGGREAGAPDPENPPYQNEGSDLKP